MKKAPELSFERLFTNVIGELPGAANDNHVALDGPDLNLLTLLRSMNHLATANIDTAVVRAGANVTRLRIGNLRPRHERVRGAQARITARQRIADQTGAVKRIRANSAPRVPAANLAVSAIDNSIAS